MKKLSPQEVQKAIERQAKEPMYVPMPKATRIAFGVVFVIITILLIALV